MVEEVFGGRRPIPERLTRFGFQMEGDAYVYRAPIFQGQFELTVNVIGADVRTELKDIATDEPYVLHLVESAAGEFVGRVRAEYRRALETIADACFERSVFAQDMTRRLISLVRERYGDEPEYLWEKFPDNAVFRRKDNAKWYGAILTVERRKLGLKGGGKVEVLDVRAEPDEVPLLVDGVRIFGGWHMNKKHWISLPLDGSVSMDEVLERLEESHFIAGER